MQYICPPGQMQRRALMAGVAALPLCGLGNARPSQAGDLQPVERLTTLEAVRELSRTVEEQLDSFVAIDMVDVVGITAGRRLVASRARCADEQDMQTTATRAFHKLEVNADHVCGLILLASAAPRAHIRGPLHHAYQYIRELAPRDAGVIYGLRLDNTKRGIELLLIAAVRQVGSTP
jgi:hypothetical protein